MHFNETPFLEELGESLLPVVFFENDVVIVGEVQVVNNICGCRWIPRPHALGAQLSSFGIVPDLQRHALPPILAHFVQLTFNESP